MEAQTTLDTCEDALSEKELAAKQVRKFKEQHDVLIVGSY